MVVIKQGLLSGRIRNALGVVREIVGGALVARNTVCGGVAVSAPLADLRVSRRRSCCRSGSDGRTRRRGANTARRFWGRSSPSRTCCGRERVYTAASGRYRLLTLRVGVTYIAVRSGIAAVSGGSARPCEIVHTGRRSRVGSGVRNTLGVMVCEDAFISWCAII